ncbi:uncharacterized protein LOC111273664 [Varroa jacobsoni]|uniref:uncharacterized protein LOC111273664 n=1 Tax=Varroa jacobsoni TaxID=62625 RepID=UPI000BF85722|nr:uncharacterized protein LOC111273664 [Varroa jacobsoni]XP_022711222.1 uncharacterized protein LOC111273664 [Varroa jacobsoni]XP_022711223.1 uncharacterized protein LOC111273664 [Varroa jacobsoni]
MISAMPAVALRREKKRSKPGLARASSAASFGGQAKDVASQGDANRAPSVSTLDIPQRIVRFKSREQEQREKLFMYCGTLCLVTGLFLLFIGVGVQVTPTRTVGLLFIALGAFLCFLKLVITPEEPRRAAPLRRHRLLGSNDSLYNLALPGVTVQDGEAEIAASKQTNRKGRRVKDNNGSQKADHVKDRNSGYKETTQGYRDQGEPGAAVGGYHQCHYQEGRSHLIIQQQQTECVSVAIEESNAETNYGYNCSAPIAKLEE